MNTHVITLWKGGAVFLTEEQNEKMRDFGKDDKAIINGRQVYGSNIADIVPIDTYYKENPKETPTPEYKMLKTGEDEEDPLTRERYLNMARSTLKGLRKYIDESAKPTPTAIAIAKKLVRKIEDVKCGAEKFAISQADLIKELN